MTVLVGNEARKLVAEHVALNVEILHHLSAVNLLGVLEIELFFLLLFQEFLLRSQLVLHFFVFCVCFHAYVIFVVFEVSLVLLNLHGDGVVTVECCLALSQV